MSLAETATVTFTVTSIERVTGHGSLVAFAAVSADLDGIAVTLDGIAVVRERDGRLIARAPQFRGANGTWRPAVGLSETLTRAMGESVLEAFAEAEADAQHRP